MCGTPPPGVILGVMLCPFAQLLPQGFEDHWIDRHRGRLSAGTQQQCLVWDAGLTGTPVLPLA